MNEKAPVPQLLDNLSPAAKHRRQMRWQIWAPLVASIVIVLTLVILTILGAVGGSSQVARWANLSAVWIILPILLVGIILLAIIAAGIYGMTKLLKRVPDWMLRLQMGMDYLVVYIRKAADAATQPVMATSGFKASARALWRKISRKPSHQPKA